MKNIARKLTLFAGTATLAVAPAIAILKESAKQAPSNTDVASTTTVSLTVQSESKQLIIQPLVQIANTTYYIHLYSDMIAFDYSSGPVYKTMTLPYRYESGKKINYTIQKHFKDTYTGVVYGLLRRNDNGVWMIPLHTGNIEVLGSYPAPQ